MGVPPIAILAAVAAIAGKPAPPFECRLTAAARAPAGGPVLVRFTLKNRSARPVAVLTWQTPLEGLLGDVFRVTKEAGEPLPYRGPMVKRGDPDADEYVRLARGAEVTEEVDVALAYDLTSPGRYAISFRGLLMDVAPPSSAPRPRGRHRPVQVDCGSVDLEIVSRPAGQSR